MEPLKVGDYVTWDLVEINKWAGLEPKTWPTRYGNVMIVTKIHFGAGDWIRVSRANGKRIMGPWSLIWFKKATFLGLAAKAIQDAKD